MLKVDPDEGPELRSDSVINVETELAAVDIGDAPSLNDPMLYEPDDAYLDPDEEGVAS